MGKVWLRYFLYASYVSFARIRTVNISNMRDVFSVCKQTRLGKEWFHNGEANFLGNDLLYQSAP